MTPRNQILGLATAIVLVGGTGAATAASGGSFILGRTNYAGGPTALRNTGAGSALHLGTANASVPPLTVGTNKTRVPYLNSDLVDGLDSAQLQRRVTGACAGGAISAVSATGTVTCATLPRRVRFNPVTPVDETVSQALASWDGVTLHASCRRTSDSTLPGAVTASLYLTGSGIVNGHLIHTDGIENTTAGIGAAIPAGGTSGELFSDSRTFADGNFERATVVAMVDNGGKVSQVTAHVFLDVRDTSPNAAPCSVWATVV